MILSELYFYYPVDRRVNMRKKLVGALIGFATGLYMASFLTNNLFSEVSFATDLYKLGLIFVNAITITGFCFIGIYFMSDKKT